MVTRFLAVAALTFLFDAACAAYVISLQRAWWPLAFMTTAVCPYLAFLYRSWFADETSTKRRMLLTTADAVGAVTATGAVLWTAHWLAN